MVACDVSRAQCLVAAGRAARLAIALLAIASLAIASLAIACALGAVRLLTRAVSRRPPPTKQRQVLGELATSPLTLGSAFVVGPLAVIAALLELPQQDIARSAMRSRARL